MQNELFTKKQLRVLLVLVLLLVVVVVGFSVYRSVTFRLVGTDPDTTAVGTISPFFKIKFNKPLSKDIVVSFSPQDLPATYEIKDSVVTVLFSQPLEQNQPYEIHLANISDIKHRHLPDKSFGFEADVIDAASLSPDQKQVLETDQRQYNDAVQNDKLVKLLPFAGGGNEFQVSYTVNYVNRKAQLIIVITSATPQGQADGLNWIRQVGFNPADYKISYITKTDDD